ncbi:hypothetical protein [Litorimonas haliclonae]|uniref:hypothetical protein n=1 Tax=Litorimonas haliclonae TaxID=2081977 RepID=UPI0039F0E557
MKKICALFTLVFTLISASMAHAQAGKTCPNGMALANTFEANFASGPNSWGQAILYWQDYGVAAVDSPTKIVRSLMECYGKYCGMGDGDTTAHTTMKQYHKDLAAYKDGRINTAPVLDEAAVSAPPPVMLEWAEKRFGCKAGPTSEQRQAKFLADYQARNAVAKTAARRKTVGVKDDWEFYEKARRNGGPDFYRWWDANKKMRTVQDAYDMCYLHPADSVECTAPKAWADRMTGKYVPRTQGLSPNTPYTESYTDKYGYKGPARSGPSAPAKSNKRRCYNQGDGTEKCFYD